jgi:hypothetical protein
VQKKIKRDLKSASAAKRRLLAGKKRGPGRKSDEEKRPHTPGGGQVQESLPYPLLREREKSAAQIEENQIWAADEVQTPALRRGRRGPRTKLRQKKGKISDIEEHTSRCKTKIFI